MRRSLFLVFLPLLGGCTISTAPAPTPPPGSAPPPTPGVAANGPLPAGLYDVSERVLFDTCRGTRSIPPRVTLLKRHTNGAPRASVPLQAFGDFDKPQKRVEFDLRGFQSSAMSHPKNCPGLQNTMTQDVVSVTDTSFQVKVDFEVKDGWDCPNPRPEPVCVTSVVYEYRLAAAACDSRCDGTVPGVADQDVPAGPVALSCTCP